jgi:hypothetical protein
MTEYKAPKCGIRYDIMQRAHYLVDDQEVSEAEYQRARKIEEAECRKLHVKQGGARLRQPGFFGDRHDFSRETDPTTGKNGRYFPQLARYSGDPRAVIRHVNDAVEIAKRRGYGVERWA